MDELITKHLQGRATPQEEWWLRRWRARDSDNERHFQEIAALWELTSVAAPVTEGQPPDVGSLIQRADAPGESRRSLPASEEESRSATVPTARAFRGWSYRFAVGAAAAVFTALGVGLGMAFAASVDADAHTPLLAATEVVTGAGELTTMTLGDGSSIRLGPNSRLRVAEEGNRRVAWLEGRAFFGVQADSTRPFVVRTGRGEAQALGTRFEVRDEDEFRVLVVDGSVAVSAAGSELRLSEGEMSRSADGAPPAAERVDDVFGYLDWLGNAIVFQATPLARAVREIERRYGVSIRLEDPELADLTVTATFTARPLEEVTYVLCEIVNAPCTVSDEVIRIGAAGSTDPTSGNPQ